MWIYPSLKAFRGTSSGAAAFLFSLAILFLLASCSSKPSESEVRQKIEQKISRNSNGLVKLVDFRKINGIEREFGGVRTYEMEWSAELEFVADCLWDSSTFKAIPPPQGLDAYLHLNMKKAAWGDRVKISGSTTLEKAENGWR